MRNDGTRYWRELNILTWQFDLKAYRSNQELDQTTNIYLNLKSKEKSMSDEWFCIT